MAVSQGCTSRGGGGGCLVYLIVLIMDRPLISLMDYTCLHPYYYYYTDKGLHCLQNVFYHVFYHVSLNTVSMSN